MKYGLMGVDFEDRVNYERLRKDRLEKARTQMIKDGLGADFDNIRYITGTTIGEWARNKMARYVILTAEGDPQLFDPATPSKRITSPWISDSVHPSVGSMRGAIPPEEGNVETVASEIKKVLEKYGAEKMPVGVDIMDVPLIRALEAENIEVVDGQQTMLDARMIKTPDEIELLKTAAAMVDATYSEIVRAIRPGMRENDLVAIANKCLYSMGSDLVECVNSVSGSRSQPHPHVFSDRMIRPGDMVYLDIMHSFNGYRTCYYRTFVCGHPTKAQEEAYNKAYQWLQASIKAVKPGATTADIAACWPTAQEIGLKDEKEAYLLQFGHGIGMSIWEKPVVSRLFMDKPFELKEGMVFALETYCPSADGKGGARIEDEVVVTKDGCEVITKFPAEELISCGLPGTKAFI
ncbi:Xaa-Pro aminopeptidase [Ureibacillus xyleni]|uniref:Xaa-Pro aminopeptidase n=1 Tax=Ureibacillus xyleni TaxID=614648 RepID=A0A285TQE2_9BACL|nr:Xaa-Pro peptidase family protein [Ureibacillus xyleni]SOC25319.1 Xaa-Pro aminopeptidase [Ureibacillus xyleni]